MFTDETPILRQTGLMSREGCEGGEGKKSASQTLRPSRNIFICVSSV
jgi:hypothetical protein